MFAAQNYYDNTGDFFHHDGRDIDSSYRRRGRRQERLRQQQVQQQRLEDRQQARLEEDQRRWRRQQRRQQERGRGDDDDNDDEYECDDATDGIDLVRSDGGDGRLFRIQTPIALNSQSRFKPVDDDDDDESESSLSDLDVDFNDSDCESDAEEDAFLASITSLMSQSFVADAITTAAIDDAVADDEDDEVRVVGDSSCVQGENTNLEDSPSYATSGRLRASGRNRSAGDRFPVGRDDAAAASGIAPPLEHRVTHGYKQTEY
eukprot:CAMPEP_0197196294 /NCGR_PEP_ID=MMETSP1423-20130617/32277_1 /TAXON_ID=476441 /ORGANISM="Pseudo-nitzschia heimii, Strain UNC1101" /LENGTH=260 /DNA_ID=CAMNT_0042650079 /DNA_START=54 /DNA_END=838 /DNA_ORIENTATION=-